MKAKKRWIAWVAAMALLCLVIGFDIARTPERQEWRGFSLVDAVSAATKPGMSVVGLIGSDYDQLENPAPRDAKLSEAQIEDMVRYAVAMAGGLRQRIEPDAEWVVIKVNIVELCEASNGVITDWRVVKGLIKILHEIVPDARISIAEGPAEWSPPDSPPVQDRGTEIADGFALAGFRQLLTDPDLEGVELDIIDLNFDSPTEVSVPDGGYAQDKWKMPLSVLECDFLISVPVLKIHDVIGMTNAMKNFVGTAPGSVYGWPKMSGYPPRSGNPGIPHTNGILDETIVDLVSMADVDFAVIDAIMCMEKAKTDKFDGIPVRMNAILASPDIVAADAVSAQLIGLNPFDFEYLTLAAYKGLGQCDPANIKIKGSPFDQLARRFIKSPADRGSGGEMGHYGQGCRTWVLKGPFTKSQQKGNAEFIDVTNPQALPGQNGWSAPVYFHDDKIDLDKYYDDPFDCVVYAYAEFTADKAQDAELWIGSDEGMKVWIDGEEVYAHEGRRRHKLPNDRAAIRVEAGRHALLVRADQNRSRFDFSLNICEVESDSRYDGNRLPGLRFAVPASQSPTPVGMEELAFGNEEGGGIPADAVILKGAQELRSERHNDRLIGAFESALRLLGEKPSYESMLATSGHAFRLSVADSLDWSGMNSIDLSAMVDLYANLGYRVSAIEAADDAPDFMAKQEEAWDAIRASIDRQMPAVALISYSYGTISGYHSRKEQYYVSHRGRLRSTPMDELGTGSRWGSGLSVLLLEGRQAVDLRKAQQRVLRFAVEEARRPDEPGSEIHHGFSAFKCWIDAVEKGAVDGRYGLSFTTAATAEGRKAAGDYLREIAAQYPEKAATALGAASDCYAREVEQLDALSELFPYRGGRPADIEDPQVRKKAGKLLRQAYAWEQKAIAQVETALAAMPAYD